MGQNGYIYMTGQEMGTARLAEQDVVLINPLEGGGDVAAATGDCLQGTGAMAVTQVSENKVPIRRVVPWALPIMMPKVI